MPLCDKVGERYGRWLVLEKLERKTGGYYWYKCRCDCGTIKEIMGGSLRKKKSTAGTYSCGCARLEKITTHGMTKTPTFKSWESMLQRCTNKNSPDYPRWGGAGITICDRWMKFENFYEDMGERPSLDHSIDRYPNKTGNYEPENCRWTTRSEQQKNKTNSRYITYKGKEKPLKDWADETGIPYDLLLRRLNRGLEGDELFAPTNRKDSRFKGVSK